MKLTSYDKERFLMSLDYMQESYGFETQHNWAFRYSRELGISIMALYTDNKYKKHIKVIISYCGAEDVFKKKLGFIECYNKLENGAGVIIPAQSFPAIDELYDFIDKQFPEVYDWQAL